MKNTNNESTKNHLNDTTKEKKILERACSKCGTIRIFKTLQGYTRSINTLCKSCNNSKKLGFDRVAKVVDGIKECLDCKEKLPMTAFVTNKNGNLHSVCTVCKKERFKIYQKTIGRFKRHGITKEIYDEMHSNQFGKCNICTKQDDKLHIDHDHITGKVRSLLCKECNLALGLLKEDKETLKNMIKYLEKHV